MPLTRRLLPFAPTETNREMAMSMSYNEIVSVIRDVVSQYYDEEFSNTDRFGSDIDLISDDLTAIALEVEKKLGVRLDRKEYRSIENIDSYARAIERCLRSPEQPPPRRKKRSSLVSRLWGWLRRGDGLDRL